METPLEQRLRAITRARLEVAWAVAGGRLPLDEGGAIETALAVSFMDGLTLGAAVAAIDDARGRQLHSRMASFLEFEPGVVDVDRSDARSILDAMGHLA